MSRVNIEITLGVILVLFTGVFLIIYGLQEEGRMEEFAEHQQAQAIEVGAELFDINCAGCHGKQGEGVLGLCPPLNDRSFFEGRIQDVGWSGSLEDYVVATVSSGRLNSTRPELYAGQGIPAMPAWSEDYGGPLREDQIRNIAAFVANWEATAPDRSKEFEISGPPVGTDVTVELPEGDPVNGELLATTKACAGCHINTTTGPGWLPDGSTPGIGERAEARYTEADYTGNAESAEQYLLESMVAPNIYVVEGYTEGIMPGIYSQSLTAQDAADLIAYMQTLR